MHQSAESLLSVINDVLDFSKIEAGKIDLEQIAFDLTEIFTNISNVIALRAKHKGVEIIFSIGDLIPKKVIGDPSRLSRVLINLTNNALKFTESGVIHINVSLEERLADRVRFHFSVKDTGIGIPP